jgi:hypothetical protein
MACVKIRSNTAARRLAVSLLVFAAACGEKGIGGGGSATDSADGDVNLPSFPMRAQPPYEEVVVRGGGSISGVVELPQGAPGPAAATGPCSAGGDTSSPATGTGALPAVVWIDDIRRGRRLDETRRFSLAASRCAFEPAVQVAIAGGTLNVRNVERLEHRLEFRRTGIRRSLFDVPFVTNGQLVPATGLLLQPGVVEAVTSQDTTVRAYIFVVDHPYVAVTDGGRFTIDSVPVGRYTVRAWTPGGLAEQSVQLSSGSTVELRLVPQAAAAR